MKEIALPDSEATLYELAVTFIKISILEILVCECGRVREEKQN